MSGTRDTPASMAHVYRIVHSTRYDFDRAVGGGSLSLRLKPRDLAAQQCLFHQAVIRPLATTRQESVDEFGNALLQLELPMSLQALQISAISRVRVTEPACRSPQASPPWEQLRDRPDKRSQPDWGWSKRDDAAGPDLREQLIDYASPAFRPGTPAMVAADELMRRIFTEFTYDPNATCLTTPVAELLRHKRGVCQDFATLMIAVLRAVGLAARYVSGYVDSTPEEGRRVIGTNAAHAWCALAVPGTSGGWVGLDPTLNSRSGTRHVTLAWGRDFDDVAPVTGSVGGDAGQRLTVSVDVERLTTAAEPSADSR